MMRTSRQLLAVLLWPLLVGDAGAADAAPRPDQLAFREIYRELVETNTTLSSGSCTLAGERMAARMRAAGFSNRELTVFADPAHPKEGGLVAVMEGSSIKLKPVLLLAHLDVVEARREDWARDPFVLVEENGYFYARGAFDDKAMAAVWVDMLIRFREAGWRPARTIRMALTCGEETSHAFNGVDWLVKNRRDLIEAEFALNEGGGGETNGKGRLVSQSMQVGEKTAQNFRLETLNVGGHASIPVRDNAIYQLSDALRAVREFEFPMQLNDTTRTYFGGMGKQRDDDMGRAMRALVEDPSNAAALRTLDTDRTYHSMLRTTCVATLLEGGHANNALPQRAGANLNCRILPGESIESTRGALERAIDDPGVKVTVVPPIRPLAMVPPLTPQMMEPAVKLAARFFPGVPVVPSMATGYTDAIYLGAANIPVYGVPGIWGDPDGNGMHGLDERIEVRSLYVGRDYLTELVKAYTGG